MNFNLDGLTLAQPHRRPELGESDQPFLDERDRSVDLGGARIHLSPLEFGVLHTLASHPAEPVSRADLLREVWGTSYDRGSNTTS